MFRLLTPRNHGLSDPTTRHLDCLRRGGASYIAIAVGRREASSQSLQRIASDVPTSGASQMHHSKFTPGHREEYKPGKHYSARLCMVTERPVRNKKLSLIRLEFKVFDDSEFRLSSPGRKACRDIIVGAGANTKEDAGVRPFIEALAVRRPNTAQGWLALQDRQQKPWVEIVFGKLDPVDERNPFDKITHFDTTGFAIAEYNDLDRDWVKVAAAARALHKADSTVRRTVDRHNKEFSRRLVRRECGKRLINIRLLRELEVPVCVSGSPECIARLCNAMKRPVENTNNTLALVRLEFEIYRLLKGQNLSSLGTFASCDIIVGAGANAARDVGVRPFIKALAVRSPDTLRCWMELPGRKETPWVKIKFGEVDQLDERHRFEEISHFDSTPFAVTEHNMRAKDWVKVREAAERLHVGKVKVRQRVDHYEKTHGSRLVRRTEGNQRKINLRLLESLLADESR